MSSKQYIHIPTQTLGFWLKDWQQRVGLIAAAELSPFDGATPAASDETELTQELLLRVRTHFEREVDQNRWYAPAFADVVANVRAELDAWLTPRGYALTELLLDREPDPSYAPRSLPLDLRCRVHVRSGSLDVALHGVFDRRSAAAWEASHEIDLAQWAHSELQAICWKCVPQKTRAELRPHHRAISRAIREDFCARAAEIGYDVRAFVVLTSLDPFADGPDVSGMRGAA